AEEALRLIEVEYEVLPAILEIEQAMAAGAPVIHDEPDSTGIHDAQHNLAGYILKEIGNVEDGFRESDLIIEREFRTQRQQHCPIEPHITISWLDSDDRLVIRTSTQVPYHTRRQVAMILQIPVQRDGTLMANQMTVLATTGAYGSHANTVQGNTGSKVLPIYRTPNMRFECHVVYTNTPVAGAFRGYGCPQGYFAQESVMDEIAYTLGMDPVELRKKNMIRLGDIDELSAQLGEGRKGLPRHIRSCGLPNAWSAALRPSTGCGNVRNIL